jgi:glycolate oxidase FAD binding subunit
MDEQPTTFEEVQDIICRHPHLLARGGGSKPVLSTPPAEVVSLDMTGLSGVVEYQPAEYTITALAGTTVRELTDLLTEQGQYLPFDPVLGGQGATLGGVVAAGTGGPGRYRYGGVRDFLLGVQFVNGQGQLVRGGGKVVKNAAGFDLPKLMVGSLGRLGVLVELTFKVFPRPIAYATLRVDYPTLNEAVAALYKLTGASLDLEALDLEPPGRLWLRIGGLPDALAPRLERLASVIGQGEQLTDIAEAQLWTDVREFAWVPADWLLVKVPLTPARIAAVEDALGPHQARRRYSVGGNLLWLAWPDSPTALSDILTILELTGLVLRGPADDPWVGRRPRPEFGRRVKQALDPDNRFPAV